MFKLIEMSRGKTSLSSSGNKDDRNSTNYWEALFKLSFILFSIKSYWFSFLGTDILVLLFIMLKNSFFLDIKSLKISLYSSLDSLFEIKGVVFSKEKSLFIDSITKILSLTP